MNSLLTAVIDGLPSVVLRSLVAGSVVLGVALVLVPHVWRRAPAGRHATYALALLAFVLFQAAGPVAPKLEVPILAPAAFASANPAQPLAWQLDVIKQSTEGIMAPRLESSSPAAENAPAAGASSSTSSEQPLSLLLLWGVPATELLGVLAAGAGSAVQATRSARSVTREVRGLIQHAPTSDILESERTTFAFAWGFLRQVILLPT